MPGTGMGQSQTCARPSLQAILPLMKFLEVELCYMNTNLVQENFSRSARPRPPGARLLRLSFLASASILRGGWHQPLLTPRDMRLPAPLRLS